MKSTSVGIKDSWDRYIAALCRNLDVSVFLGLTSMLAQFVEVDPAQRESLDPVGAEALKARIDAFDVQRSVTARTLSPQERRPLLSELRASGHLEVRRAMKIVAQHLCISRAAAYSAAKQARVRRGEGGEAAAGGLMV